MFSKKIIDGDEFLDMPLETQSLYFHLAMRADDDGFINNARKLIRAIGASQSDLETLIEKGFIIAFESGILAIRHWKVHNLIRYDRYKATMFLEERGKLDFDENGIYIYADNNSGNQVATNWQPSDNQMATNWQPSDNQMATNWQPSDNQVATNWQPNCNQVATQVRLGKDSIGKDSIGKDSIDKVSLGEERIVEDSLEVVEGSIVEVDTTPTYTKREEDNSSLMANNGEAIHTAPITNCEEREDYSHPTYTKREEDNSFLMANNGEAIHTAPITNCEEREDYSYPTHTKIEEDNSSLMANNGEAIHTAPITNYEEREDYSHSTHTKREEDSSSLMANNGDAIHTAPITNYGEREDYAPTPTHHIYNMKENDSLDVANRDGFYYADDEYYSADYDELQEADYEECNWELPEDYVSENPPPIGLDDGYFASLDDKDAPPEDDDLPWSRGNAAPENDGDYGEVFSGDWAVSTAPKRRHEAIENSAREFGESESALTVKEPHEGIGRGCTDGLTTPKASVNDGEIKPVLGDHGRGIVCLSEWQLSDLKEKLGEHHLNRYMDKLATFISQRGAHVRSHYDTILKWYNEDFTERERRGADASYRANNSPKSSQNYPGTQVCSTPPQHERYGNFDPKEAFKAALRRSFGEDYDIDSIKI